MLYFAAILFLGDQRGVYLVEEEIPAFAISLIQFKPKERVRTAKYLFIILILFFSFVVCLFHVFGFHRNFFEVKYCVFS